MMKTKNKDILDFLIVPFHDWRKIQLEGYRTRDAHFIEELAKNEGIKIIINRPTTYLEILLKRKLGLIKGERILRRGSFSLYRMGNNLYLIDYISNDLFGQITKKFSWFMQKYGEKNYIKFIHESLEHLGIKSDLCILNQNIFAFRLTKEMSAKVKIFDAWDNFVKFDVYSGIRDKIKAAYSSFGESCDFWITNSIDNIDFFGSRFQPNKIYLIKNGVDLNRFSPNDSTIPEDLKEIPRPIAGFGGKITHLIDVPLLNGAIKKAKETSFVFVGQILDRDVYEAIDKTENFYYLGDKHYENYPNYVKNFDVCIVPYVVDEEKKSGANTIKVYEYLATGKKVIGTSSNGLEDLEQNVYLVKTSDEFAFELKNIANNKERIDLLEHSWSNKTKQMLTLLQNNGGKIIQ